MIPSNLVIFSLGPSSRVLHCRLYMAIHCTVISLIAKVFNIFKIYWFEKNSVFLHPSLPLQGFRRKSPFTVLHINCAKLTVSHLGTMFECPGSRSTELSPVGTLCSSVIELCCRTIHLSTASLCYDLIKKLKFSHILHGFTFHTKQERLLGGEPVIE